MKTFERDDVQWEKRRSVSVDEHTLREAQDYIASCEACAPDDADILFDDVLDVLTGCDPQYTDYILKVPARCPRCDAAVRAGRWQWLTGPDGKRRAWIIPGTLVSTRDIIGR
jgi:hypothetical protein